MKEAWRNYLGVRAPRYTSYPSAQYFDAGVTARDFAAALERIDIYEPLSLYIHIPFCRQLCWYCGCNMRVETRYERALRYVAAICREILLAGRRLNGNGRVGAVHFGGGTPNFLALDQLAEILVAVERELGLTDDALLSIELDPRLVGRGDAARLVELGFRRFSLGVQDFAPAVQEAINRRQTFEEIENVVGDLRVAGVDDVSFDLIYGLPRQDEARFSDTIEKTIALAPDRVSVFGYAHLPDVLPHQRLIRSEELPCHEARAELALLADRMLVRGGYRRVGFDHYARASSPLARAAAEGRLRRNFQGFTEDQARTIIAFGASAISTIGALQAQNAKDLAAYYAAVEAHGFATERGIEATGQERVVGRTIETLLCRGEADISAVLAAATPAEANAICGRLDALEADGVVSWRGDVVSIREEARLLSRIAAAALDPYEQSLFAPAGTGSLAI